MERVGRYRIVERLGQGGMGVVFKAFDPQIERTVAIKVISSQRVDNPELRERFFREARSAGQLTHRNIIVVYDIGEEQGQPWLAMEYVDGVTLDVLMRGPHPFPIGRRLEVMLDVCSGLAYAHDRGIIHRDVKPSNIIVTRAGSAKILDFGLARLVSSDLTRSNLMLGTMSYMAPEQLRNEPIDQRVDIFAVGVVMYELFTGLRPFDGESLASAIYNVLETEPLPVDQCNPAIPPELGPIVARALAKDRDQRYQTMHELGEDLESVRASLPEDLISEAGPLLAPHAVASDFEPTVLRDTTPGGGRPFTPMPRPRTPTPRPLASRPPTPRPSAEPAPETSRPRFRGRGALIGIVSAVLLVSAIVVAVFLRGRPGETAEQVSKAVPATQPAEPDGPGRGAPSASPDVPSPRDSPGARQTDREAASPPAASGNPQSPVDSSREIADEAMRQLARARSQADAAGARQFATEAYEAAQRAESTARRRYAAGDFAEATTALYESSGLYRTAGTEARRQRALRERSDQEARAGELAALERRIGAARDTFERRRSEAETVGAPQRAARTFSAAMQHAATASQQAADESAVREYELGASLMAEARQQALDAAARERAAQAAATSPPAPVTRPAAPAGGAAAAATPPEPPAEETIRAVLAQYVSALEARDLGALKRIWPSLSGPQEEAIRDEFRNARDIDVTIDAPRITVTGDSATVSCLRRYRLQTRDGHRLQTDTRTTVVLRKAARASWIIEAIRYEQP